MVRIFKAQIASNCIILQLNFKPFLRPNAAALGFAPEFFIMPKRRQPPWWWRWLMHTLQYRPASTTLKVRRSVIAPVAASTTRHSYSPASDARTFLTVSTAPLFGIECLGLSCSRRPCLNHVTSSLYRAASEQSNSTSELRSNCATTLRSWSKTRHNVMVTITLRITLVLTAKFKDNLDKKKKKKKNLFITNKHIHQSSN